MKKTILFCCCICLFAATAFAQSSTPDVVKTNFAAQYPNVKVDDWDWEDDKGLYEAEFKLNDKEYEAYFTPDGKWVMTKRELKKVELPATVTASIGQGEYSAWNISDRYEIDSPEGKKYKVKAEKGGQTLYLKFDGSGKMLGSKLKEEKKSDKKQGI